MKRVLICGADTVGSFVLASPFYRELRKNLPDAYIALYIKPLVYELAKDCPYVDKIIVRNTGTLWDKVKQLSSLKKEKFDTAFLISGSFESAMIVFLAGIKNRIGYDHDKRRFLLTHKVEEREKRHYIDYILNILESKGLKIEDRKTEIYIKETKTQFDDLFTEREKIIGLNLTVIGEPARNWSKEYALKLIQKLLKQNYKIILFGTNNGIEYGKYIESRVDDNNFINLVGKTSLTEFVNLVRRCNLYISVATGGIHIASTLGIPVIGLYCPGDDFSWGPKGTNVKIITKKVDCAPCDQHKMKWCKDNKCMKSILPQDVEEMILESMK